MQELPGKKSDWNSVNNLFSMKLLSKKLKMIHQILCGRQEVYWLVYSLNVYFLFCKSKKKKIVKIPQ